MITRFDPKIKKEVIIISPGEYFACRDDRVISTLLGSCVAVCLRDQKTGTAGMNHFMLAGDYGPGPLGSAPAGRYGLFAMELLIGEMIKLGSSRQGLTAKVFGGGHMFSTITSGSTVPENNVRFIENFLAQEGIETLASDLGGDKGRRVVFHTGSGDVFVKKLAGRPEDELVRAERRLKNKLTDSDCKPGEVELFD